MAHWLAKSEPGAYSFADLEREGRTEWSGVHNALALQHLKRMRPGDTVLFYHSGPERAAVGIARVTGQPHPDPEDDRGSWSVEVRPGRRLRGAVSLSELRADPGLAGFLLLRMSRLSVMPVTPEQWTRILGHEPPAPDPRGTGVRARPGGRARASASPRGGTGARRRR
jgi:predicted RNA-binding protein with PUA-like domain